MAASQEPLKAWVGESILRRWTRLVAGALVSTLPRWWPLPASPSSPPALRSRLRARTAAAPQTAAPTGPPVPGAPKCQMFPADNVWNTDISTLPVNKHSATWMAHMDASSIDLHPDFGPNQGGYPYGIPWTVINPKTQAFIHLRFDYADESDRGPYPFGPNTPVEGGRNASGDRHALMVDPATCVLYELYDAHYVSTDGLDRRLRRHLEPELERPASRHLDIGRRGRSPDPARPALVPGGPRRQGRPRDPLHDPVHRRRVHLAGAARSRFVRK